MATPAQPKGVIAHFVYDPHKRPGAAAYNATDIGLMVESVRAGFENGTIDQYVDNHIGLVVPSLDPFVERWEAAKVPFICRTWCCGPGMPAYEAGACPAYSFNRTDGCETGCYIEAPHGIIVEMQCGLNSYAESLACLTRANPAVFDMCSAS
uniref:Uncharacterized protein n=1 Tax=Prymnesium polylepis TaxID=72548 RepID=A0A7S4HG88_9EUKA